VFIHLLGAVAFHKIPKSVEQLNSTGLPTASLTFLPSKTRRRFPNFSHPWDEFKTCYGNAERRIQAQPPNLIPIILNNLAQMLVVLHILIGTIIFSSCQFLRFTDAIPVIARYAASSLVCRFINVYELRGMNARLVVDVTECGSASKMANLTACESPASARKLRGTKT
jgi:hypothetical protein